MSSETLDIYRSHFTEQFDSGPMSETGYIDPSGDNVEISGVFDDSPIFQNKDGGNVHQKATKARFYVSDFTQDYNYYIDKRLHLPYRDRLLTIKYIDKDAEGVNILWLA